MHPLENATAPQSASDKRRSALERRLDPLLGLLSLVFLLACASCAPALNQNLVQVDTEHIRLRSNRGESAARKMAERLERMDEVVHSSVLRCGFADRTDRIALASALKWPDAFLALTRAGHLSPHGVPENVARLRSLRSHLEKLRAEHPGPPSTPPTNQPVPFDGATPEGDDGPG